eukprot:scaffold6781_cov204-Amphora_coffeaeformis.AAC.14
MAVASLSRQPWVDVVLAGSGAVGHGGCVMLCESLADALSIKEADVLSCGSKDVAKLLMKYDLRKLFVQVCPGDDDLMMPSKK